MVIVYLTSLFLITSYGHASAYLDPGTGSYFFQILMAAILGVAFSLKMSWKKITSFIENMFAKGHKRDDKNP